MSGPDVTDSPVLDGAPARLPRGRHGLSRDEVERSQRGRILFAMADAMAEKGYGATSVADVLRGAGVSRQTFYALFTSKEDCFASAFDAAAQIVQQRVVDRATADGAEADPAPSGWTAGVAPASGPDVLAERLDRLLGAFLDAIADEPAFARLFLVEVYAAGPEALDRRIASQERFAALIATLVGARGEDERFLCEAVVAAISTLVTTRVATGDMDAVRRLRGPLSRLVRRGMPLLVDADGA
ncbi:MAG: TetR/AcrR family transcriptional regulator [Solirubrobacteraceae bacterium]|nr:TetR/AcrR family transcriptional regulator [Solirubrobacteraceae bacterium]